MIDSSAHADAFLVVQLGVLQQLCTKQCDSQTNDSNRIVIFSE